MALRNYVATRAVHRCARASDRIASALRMTRTLRGIWEKRDPALFSKLGNDTQVKQIPSSWADRNSWGLEGVRAGKKREGAMDSDQQAKLREALALFADELSAIRYLEGILWPNGVSCPHCGRAPAPIYLCRQVSMLFLRTSLCSVLVIATRGQSQITSVLSQNESPSEIGQSTPLRAALW